ncbi:MAG: cyclopropane-fatty-acyl-phospholipid synthase family protein [Verrucomicrobia bacterium]|nr:cyclopropane-fatty-acyl-phospholipid synthase family protein [Verrucomicrobiota bacterium]
MSSKQTLAFPVAEYPEVPAKSASFARRIILGLLRDFTKGRLEFTLPDGHVLVFGDPNLQAVDVARITIHRERFFRHVLFYGDIGFGECFMDGDWSSDDVPAVLAFFLQNIEQTPGLAGSRRREWLVNILKWANRLGHVFRRNTKSNSCRNIQEHYDLSNEFYAMWLDATWTYSSAYFQSPSESLEQAQNNKYRQLCEKLHLKPGMEVLEIGCGWGGFAIFAARHFGVKVTGLTISNEQLAKARARVAEAGLDDQIQILFRDYRDMTGTFDAIVSIEMLEAVGHAFLRDYFAQCHNLLKPQGVLGLQVIVTPDNRYEYGRKSVDWIQKHIFPGGQLPSLTAIQQAINRTGDMYLQHLESFGLHYAETLRRWRETFNSRLDDVLQQGFDQRFVRKWNYYLCYCEAAFQQRNINVAQMVFTRPNNVRYMIPTEASGLGVKN